MHAAINRTTTTAFHDSGTVTNPHPRLPPHMNKKPRVLKDPGRLLLRLDSNQ